MSKSNYSSDGVGFWGLLVIALIVLKLCHVIGWSWWLVLAPAWIGAAIGLLLIVFLILWGIGEDRKQERRARMTWEERLKEMQDKKAARK